MRVGLLEIFFMMSCILAPVSFGSISVRDFSIGKFSGIMITAIRPQRSLSSMVFALGMNHLNTGPWTEIDLQSVFCTLKALLIIFP